MLGDYFSISFKNLKHRGIRSWLTLIGIFIGIAAVVSLISLGNGLQAAVNAQFDVSSTQALTVQAGGLNSYGAPGTGVVNPLTKEDSDEIGKLSSVEFATPRNIRTIQVEYNDKVIFGTALSTDEESAEEMYEVMGLEIESGRLLEKGDVKKVVLGNNLADGTKNGFDKDIVPSKTILIQGEEFKVIGIIEKQGSFTLDNIVLIYNNDLNALLNYGDEVDIIGVKVKNKDLMDKAKEDIERLMRKRRGVKEGEEDFSVETPEALLGTISSIINGIKAFIIIIASISIVVGGIGIINTMTTSVLERKKEIGIMKSIGARNSNIFFQFLVESGMMGLIGGVVGAGVGMTVGYLGTIGINSFIGSELTPTINWGLIIFALLGSFIVGSIAGIAPAMQAAKQNPVEALRS